MKYQAYLQLPGKLTVIELDDSSLEDFTECVEVLNEDCISGFHVVRPSKEEAVHLLLEYVNCQIQKTSKLLQFLQSSKKSLESAEVSG